MPLSPSHLAPRRRTAPTLHGRGVLFSVHGRRYAVEAARVKHLLRDEGGAGAPVVFLGVPYPVLDLRAHGTAPWAARAAAYSCWWRASVSRGRSSPTWS